MHISFTIPIWVFVALAVYYSIGLLLWAPLWFYSSRFISPSRRGREVWHGVTTLQLFGTCFIGSGLFWPLILQECVRNDWKYGVGHRIRGRWHRDGCCSACKGTGCSNDPETNGRCWDCRGTGHPHEMHWPNR